MQKNFSEQNEISDRVRMHSRNLSPGKGKSTKVDRTDSERLSSRTGMFKSSSRVDLINPQSFYNQGDYHQPRSFSKGDIGHKRKEENNSFSNTRNLLRQNNLENSRTRKQIFDNDRSEGLYKGQDMEDNLKDLKNNTDFSENQNQSLEKFKHQNLDDNFSNENYSKIEPSRKMRVTQNINSNLLSAYSSKNDIHKDNLEPIKESIEESTREYKTDSQNAYIDNNIPNFNNVPKTNNISNINLMNKLNQGSTNFHNLLNVKKNEGVFTKASPSPGRKMHAVYNGVQFDGSDRKPDRKGSILQDLGMGGENSINTIRLHPRSSSISKFGTISSNTYSEIDISKNMNIPEKKCPISDYRKRTVIQDGAGIFKTRNHLTGKGNENDMSGAGSLFQKNTEDSSVVFKNAGASQFSKLNQKIQNVGNNGFWLSNSQISPYELEGQTKSSQLTDSTTDKVSYPVNTNKINFANQGQNIDIKNNSHYNTYVSNTRNNEILNKEFGNFENQIQINEPHDQAKITINLNHNTYQNIYSINAAGVNNRGIVIENNENRGDSTFINQNAPIVPQFSAPPTNVHNNVNRNLQQENIGSINSFNQSSYIGMPKNYIQQPSRGYTQTQDDWGKNTNNHHMNINQQPQHTNHDNIIKIVGTHHHGGAVANPSMSWNNQNNTDMLRNNLSQNIRENVSPSRGYPLYRNTDEKSLSSIMITQISSNYTHEIIGSQKTQCQSNQGPIPIGSRQNNNQGGYVRGGGFRYQQNSYDPFHAYNPNPNHKIGKPAEKIHSTTNLGPNNNTYYSKGIDENYLSSYTSNGGLTFNRNSTKQNNINDNKCSNIHLKYRQNDS